IATIVGTAEPHSFDALVSKARNVERQIGRQKNVPQKSRMTKDKKFDNKKQTKKDEAMPTFVNVNKKIENGKGNEIPKNGKETSKNPLFK
ncbi:unnamed protein product, partial [Ilex paraguariensis]